MVLKRILCIFALMALLFLTACPQPQPPVTTTILDTTKIADSNTRDALTSFDMDSGDIHFSKLTPFLENLQVNDVLVGKPSEAAPYGYLRKVLDINKDATGVQLKTIVASLTDAISEGELHTKGDFKSEDLLATESYYPNITMGAIKRDEFTTSNLLPGYDFFISFDQTLLDVNQNGVKAKVKVSGEVNLKSGYNIDVDIKPCLKVICFKGFTATIGYDERVNIAISGEADAKLSREFKVGQYYFKPLVVFVGPVPIVFVPTLAVYLGASGEISLKFKYGVDERIVAQLGARWDGNKWENISAADVQVKGINEIDLNGAFNAELYVKPTTALLVYGTGGFTAALQPGLQMSASPNSDPFWQLDAVLKGTMGVGVDLPLGGQLESVELELFNKKIPLKKAPNLPPKITLFQNPAKADLGRPYYLLDLRPEGLCGDFFCVQDPEGGNLKVKLSSSLEGELPAGGQYTFKIAGTHAITITATDPKGNTSQAVLNLNVVNAPPDILFSPYNTTIAQGIPIFINVSADDLNSGRLACSSLRWSVNSPDILTTELNASVGCNAKVIFGEQGKRSLNLSVSDPQGAKTQKSLEFTVTEPPLHAPPEIASMEVFDTYATSMHQVQTGEKVIFGHILKFSVAVSNPDNLTVTYSWNVSSGQKFIPIGGNEPEVNWSAGDQIGAGADVLVLLNVSWTDSDNKTFNSNQRLTFSVTPEGPR